MQNPLILSIVLPAAFGALCAIVAHKKNRSVYGWFFAGVLIGPFGLIVAFLPKIKPAVIVVDVQRDFTTAHNGALAVPSADQSYLKKVSEATRQLKELGLVIFATQDCHPVDHTSFASNHEGKQAFEIIELPDGRLQTLWPSHCVRDSTGSAIALESDLIHEVVQKGTDPRFDSYSGFRDDSGARTKLHELLKDNGCKSVIVYGIATDYCVKATVLDAIKLGYKAYVIEDLCRGVNNDASKEALELMARTGASILPNFDLTQIKRI